MRASTTHFGTSRNHFGTSRNRFGTSRNRFGTSRNHFGTSRNHFGTSRNHFGTSRNRFGTSRNRFGTSRNHFGTSRNHFGTATSKSRYNQSMRRRDYIPVRDADFDSWQANFQAYGNANLAGLGVRKHFIGHWVNSRGEAGSLSETVSATIPG